MTPTLAQLDSGVEPPEHYTEGGYHPVKIDDTFSNGRYRILHKLGYGAASTVWLALNQHQGHKNAPKARYVAIKIVTARMSKSESGILHRLKPAKGWLHRFLGAFRRSGRFLTSLVGHIIPFLHPLVSRDSSGDSQDEPQHPGHEFVVSLLDEFSCEGPNGHHSCLVTNLLGPNLSALEGMDMMGNGDYLLPVALTRQIIYQCAKGLDFLHSRGVVHGGQPPPSSD
jgi:serine/threonine-protein kinase SRPK3